MYITIVINTNNNNITLHDMENLIEVEKAKIHLTLPDKKIFCNYEPGKTEITEKRRDKTIENNLDIANQSLLFL